MVKGNKNTATENKEKVSVKPSDLEVTKAKEYGEKGWMINLKLFGCIYINGCWLKESREGKDFIAFPSYKGSDNKYYNHVSFYVTDELIEHINKEIEKTIG